MFSKAINSLQDLPLAARDFLTTFKDDRIFAFYGKMGSGKTTFIKELSLQMGTTDNITSPTFALINEYDLPFHQKIFHFDFYRIKDLNEAMDIGYYDYIESGNYCMMEWSEKIEPLLPDHYVHISIEPTGPDSRLLKAVRI